MKCKDNILISFTFNLTDIFFFFSNEVQTLKCSIYYVIVPEMACCKEIQQQPNKSKTLNVLAYVNNQNIQAVN